MPYVAEVQVPLKYEYLLSSRVFNQFPKAAMEADMIKV
jgi:hypothetical protein